MQSSFRVRKGIAAIFFGRLCFRGFTQATKRYKFTTAAVKVPHWHMSLVNIFRMAQSLMKKYNRLWLSLTFGWKKSGKITNQPLRYPELLSCYPEVNNTNFYPEVLTAGYI